MVLFKKEICFCPKSLLFKTDIIAVRVVIFIPPAVPEGEAPMYIKNVMNSKMGKLSSPVEIVLKPTVVIAVIA
ncbi:hypothetical protein GCM10027164_32810 [Algoriphagus taiwanensis]